MAACQVWWCVVEAERDRPACALHAKYPLADPHETREAWTARISPAERAAAMATRRVEASR